MQQKSVASEDNNLKASSFTMLMDIENWRVSTGPEIAAFLDAKLPEKKVGDTKPDILVVRSRLKPVDVYSYLKARFGMPNGFLNFLRRDDSDNLTYWDFNLKADSIDLYLAGTSREIQISVPERLSDEEWKSLVLAIRGDYVRVAEAKSDVLHSFEKYYIFQNKFVSLAGLCAELHSSILDADAKPKIPFRLDTKLQAEKYHAAVASLTERGEKIFQDSLMLRLITPIMAEAYINMLILILCKDSIRRSPELFRGFIREKISRRLALLNVNCDGFDRPVDFKTPAYKAFLRVMNKRNFNLHGNVDPLREKIETVYFEGRRPLFANSGSNIERFFDQLETLHQPDQAVQEYEAVHIFLVEIADCLSERHRAFVDQVISDAYPGYDVVRHRATRLFPDHVITSIIPHVRYDDELNVQWDR